MVLFYPGIDLHLNRTLMVLIKKQYLFFESPFQVWGQRGCRAGDTGWKPPCVRQVQVSV